MIRENGADGGETRDLPRVAEKRRARTDPDDGSVKADAGTGWLESGTEDPAFFIKPNDGE